MKHRQKRGRTLTKQHKENISKAMKGREIKKETKMKMRLAALGSKNHFYGKKHTIQSKVKMSLSTSKKWLDPEYQKNYAKGRNVKPSSCEKTLEKLIKKLSLSYDYTGDFRLFIGTKNPDFVNIKKKGIIELFGKHFHSKQITGKEPIQEETDRIKYFERFGWKTLIIWEQELKDEKILLKKILAFEQTKPNTKKRF